MNTSELDSKDVLRVIRMGEGMTVEFKKAKNSLPGNLFDSVTAFLNRNGGHVVLGVADDKTIEGVDEDAVDKLCKEIATLSNNPDKLDPTYLLDPQVVDCNGKKLIYFFVPASSQVHRTNRKVYDRGVDGDFVVKNQSAISAMYLRKCSAYSENTIYPFMIESDLKRGLLTKAKDLIRAYRPNHPWLKLNKIDFFKATGLYRTDLSLGQSGYTLAALLLFGTDEAISSALPYYKIEAIVRKHDLERYDDRLTVSCNLIEAYDMLIGFIEKHLSDKFYMEGDVRISLRDKIFREVIVNMLIHREYMNPIPTTLVIYADKLITNNANKPFAYDNLTSQLQSFPKNPHIATFFAQMARAEYLGTGIRKIGELCKKYSGKAPVFKDNDIFIAEIPLPVLTPRTDGGLNGTLNGTLNGALNGTLSGGLSGGLNGGLNGGLKIKLNEKQIKVYDAIVMKNGIQIQHLSSLLSIPIDTLDKIISHLVKNNLVERRGSKKTGGYWIKEEK